MHSDYWFPHVPLALAMVVGGLLLRQLNFAGRCSAARKRWRIAAWIFHRNCCPRPLIGGAMPSMAIGLLWRSHPARTMALLLVP